jgi:ATP-binding cassette, subfamily C (CFTR/MRP), member 1
VALGVAMSNVLGFSQSLAQFVCNYADLETSLQAVARVKDYVEDTTPQDLPQENQPLSEQWPTVGAVEFRSITASYKGSS